MRFNDTYEWQYGSNLSVKWVLFAASHLAYPCVWVFIGQSMSDIPESIV